VVQVQTKDSRELFTDTSEHIRFLLFFRFLVVGSVRRLSSFWAHVETAYRIVDYWTASNQEWVVPTQPWPVLRFSHTMSFFVL